MLFSWSRWMSVAPRAAMFASIICHVSVSRKNNELTALVADIPSSKIHPRYLAGKLKFSEKGVRHVEARLAASHDRVKGATRCLERLKSAKTVLKRAGYGRGARCV